MLTEEATEDVQRAGLLWCKVHEAQTMTSTCEMIEMTYSRM